MSHPKLHDVCTCLDKACHSDARWALAQASSSCICVQLPRLADSSCTTLLHISFFAGIVFEARDRKGELRAIAGGGRYDQLLETFGGEHQPCAGFGFGDAVIVELLKDKGLIPQLSNKVYLYLQTACF